MCRLLVATLLLAVSAPITAQAVEIISCDVEHDIPGEIAAELDKVLTDMVDPGSEVASRIGYAPGGVLSVRGADWRYARAAGTADPDQGAPMGCDMPFQIGSNTKMMTAVVLLQLQEEGALRLDDPLSRHLPELAAALPDGDSMTLRELANHTSGVFSYTDNAPDGTPGIMEGDLKDPDALRRGYAMEELVRFAIDHGKPSFSPGAEGQWAYSNTGYVLLGLVIEKIEDRPIAEIFESRIFGPLELDNSLYVNGVPDIDIGLPRAYWAAPFDVETTEWNMSQGAAAGAVVSTTDDMHVFIEALLAGDLFESEATLAEMKVAVPTGGGAVRAYGIGLAEKGDAVWGHGGQTLGFESEVVLFEEPALSVVGWGTSANNVMGLGASAVSSALVKAGILPDPALKQSADLRQSIMRSEWVLVSITSAAENLIQPSNPENYRIAFESAGRFAAQADCNRVLGEWALNVLDLTIRPGPTTRAACPPGSFSDSFIELLGNVHGAYSGDDETLQIFSYLEGTFTALEFARSK